MPANVAATLTTMTTIADTDLATFVVQRHDSLPLLLNTSENNQPNNTASRTAPHCIVAPRECPVCGGVEKRSSHGPTRRRPAPPMRITMPRPTAALLFQTGRSE